MRYWCANCGKEVPASEVEHYHSLGAMHKTCRSGKVTPLRDEKQESD